MSRPLRACVSGSFHSAMSQIQSAVFALRDAGVEVLSPADPRIVCEFGKFLFVASDITRAIKIVQDRHHAAIRYSDFVWLVAPDGYVGASASMEIGVADAFNVPVYSDSQPNDTTLRQYVIVVPGVTVPLRLLPPSRNGTSGSLDLLLDPDHAVDHIHGELEVIRRLLTTAHGTFADDDQNIRAASEQIRRELEVATR